MFSHQLISRKPSPWPQENKKKKAYTSTKPCVHRIVPVRKGTARLIASCGIPSRITYNETVPRHISMVEYIQCILYIRTAKKKKTNTKKEN